MGGLCFYGGAAFAAPVTYTIEGTVNFASASANLLPVTRDYIRNRVPDGATFAVSFDLEFATPDTDPSPDLGFFDKAISNQSAVIGGNTFSRIPGSSCNHPLECNVTAENRDISPFVQFNLFQITSGFTYSTELGEELFTLATGAPPVLSTPLVTTAFSFFESLPGLRDPLDILDPTTLSFPGAQQLTIFTQSYSTADGREGTLQYDLTVSSVREGGLVAQIHAPGAAIILLFGVFALVRTGRATRQT